MAATTTKRQVCFGLIAGTPGTFRTTHGSYTIRGRRAANAEPKMDEGQRSMDSREFRLFRRRATPRALPVYPAAFALWMASRSNILMGFAKSAHVAGRCDSPGFDKREGRLNGTSRSEKRYGH